MSDGSEYVSNHDRGAFGKLLAEAKGYKVDALDFHIEFYGPVTREGDIDETERWRVTATFTRGAEIYASGRTGEEALRRLVEKLRG